MSNHQCKHNSTSELDARQESSALQSMTGFEQLALPLTDSERAASQRQLDKLHPGNRFRLMFGQPLLPELRDPPKISRDIDARKI